MTEQPSSAPEREPAERRGLSALTEHLGLKAIAVALAVLLWFVLHLHIVRH